MDASDIRIIRSTNLKDKPKDSELVFGKYFSDHMFIMNYEDGKGWFDPRIVPYGPLDLEPAAMVLHYSQSAFEGMKAYRTPEDKIVLFRPSANFKRLNSSDDRLCMPPLDEAFAEVALKELIKVDADWVPRSPDTSLYIRPFTIATEPAVGVKASSTYMFIIILSPVGPYFPEGLNPVKISIEEEYVRAIRGGLGYTKATANYAMSLKGQMKAKANGFSQVLWLDGIERKYVEEVGTMNVFFKIGGKIITPALSGSILPGITRDSVITMLHDFGYEVEEGRLSVDDLYAASQNGTLEEAWGTGTAAVISPIGEFKWGDKFFPVGDKKTGPVAAKLHKELTSLQCGKTPDKYGWVVPVN